MEYGTVIGATATPGTTASMVAAWPLCGVMREYGKDGPDADSDPDLTPDGTGKYATPGYQGRFFSSYKDDPNDILSYRFDDDRWWTWYHEPADNLPGSIWLPKAVQFAGNLAGHPDANHVLGFGPNLTRWGILQGIASQYWDASFDFFSADTYNQNTDIYPSPEQMFGPIVDQAEEFGVPWHVGEWGSIRLSWDTSGNARADWIGACIDWQRANGCVSTAWWDINSCRVSNHPEWPEFAVLRDSMTLA